MEELLFLFIAVLLSICYGNDTKSSQPVLLDKNISLNSNPEFNVVSYDKTATMVKERLIQIYNSDIEGKREKIIGLLMQLDRLEDTDIFFEANDHIRSYIFTPT